MSMRPVFTVAVALLLAAGVPHNGPAAGRFDTKLTADQQILQALNRLTFGPRPGDADEVRKIGVEKWIELQLHPDQIPENPELDARLKPLDSLHMTSGEIFQEYFQQNQMAMMRTSPMMDLLTNDQRRKVNNGTVEERKAVILSLDPEKRWQLLVTLSPNVLEGLPEDIQEETKLARQRQQDERQKEQRKLHPPMQDLLTPAEAQIALRGSKSDREALFDSMDVTKRQQLAWAMNPGALADFPEMRRMGAVARNPRQIVLDDLREARMYRALFSNRQLEEVLTDFWFNHFNVFESKGMPEQLTVTSFENDAIRPHVLGHFKDLLLATARHPAMLYYLDNWSSMAGEVFNVGPFAQGQFGNPNFLAQQAHGLNENYGRELMELHTLGVKGGYTQDDVINVARCFTGWTIRAPNTKPEYVFAAFMHDAGEKTVLGHKIAAGGAEQDGLQAIDILAHHPSTAQFISRKLAQRFVADDPPAALVDKMAKTFLKTDGDLRAVMETMLKSSEFFSEGAWQTKIKSPLEMVASAVRVTGAETADTFTLAQKVTDMGEPLYGKLEPSGFKDGTETWLSTANLMARINFANALAAGNVPGVKIDTARFADKDSAEIAHDLLNRDPSPETLAAIQMVNIQKGIPDKPASPAIVGLVIASPEFQRR
jgi:uncharacterized protein (DUF1800 family)